MKKFFLLFALILTTAIAFVCTSCGDDDEPTSELFYVAGITEYDGPESSGEIAKINEIYYQALGINREAFTMKGTEKECNEKIRKDCEKAEAAILRETWNCTFTYSIRLVNKDKTIYSFTYPKRGN